VDARPQARDPPRASLAHRLAGAKNLRPATSSAEERDDLTSATFLLCYVAMLVARLRTWICREHRRFEALVESQAHEGRLTCPRSRESRELKCCVRCVHFAGVSPGPRGLLLRCLTTDDDPVMVRAEGWHGVTVDADLAPERARELVHRHDLLLAPVVERGLVVGVVYREALERGLAELPVEVPWAIDVLATLGDATDALSELGVPGLFVVSPCGELLNVLSVADLLRVGVPVEELEPREPVTQLRAAR
jgi:hypothetical protein